MKQESVIQRNPRIGFGCYTVRGTGIRVHIIRSRHREGESIRLLAKDYRLPVATIKACINFRETRVKSERR